MPTPLTDSHGCPITGANSAALAYFDQAVASFGLYRGDPVALLDNACQEAPGFVMAHLLKAYLYAVATEPDAARLARVLADGIRAMPRNERETSHLAALDHMLAGGWSAAARVLDGINVYYPRDLVALQIGHLVDFYRANARSLRDRIARVLPQWSPELAGYSLLLGMFAFGLEETGDYARAEATGREAITRQPFDCWAHHAVTHVMEMQGRSQDGVGWMITREPWWAADDNLFKVHNWWHRALFHLDLEQSAQALDLYDSRIRQTRSAVVLDMVDASALLWRLHLIGCDVGQRWTELATAWDAHADGMLYPFNDWHAVMAYLGAQRGTEVERLLGALRLCAASGSETGRWARETGLPLIQGFVAFWRGDYRDATDLLFGARAVANSWGGSHAQRDVIDWTLIEAALRGGQTELATALSHERLSLKPHSPVNRRLLARSMAPADSMAASGT